MNGTSVEERLAIAAEACRLKLQEDSFSRVLGRLGPLGQPDQAFKFLSQITLHAESSAEVTRLCASIPSDPDQNVVERTLLVLASQYAIPRVPDLAVSDSVKGLFADEFLFFANPPVAWVVQFQSDNERYREMARIATLRRFPAGQFHWEVSALSRSSAVKSRQRWRVLAYVMGRMGGFKPLFETHVNARRKNRLVLLEREANISYYRVARALEKQPSVRGLITTSWLYCESTAQITPHLAWLRKTPQSAGALLFEVGPAPTNSGFMTGSEERRKLYEQGLYRPTLTSVLWSRKALIDWANRHPEFDA